MVQPPLEVAEGRDVAPKHDQKLSVWIYSRMVRMSEESRLWGPAAMVPLM